MVAYRLVIALLAMLSLSSTALGQSLENPLGIVAGETKSGALVVCGGGRLPEEAYQEFIRLAGGKDAKLIHIPWAHPFSSMTSVRSSYNGWLGYHVASFGFLNVDAREEADVDAFIKPLENATGVWIGGGSQGRLANLYGNTKVEAALQRVLARGGVVGGTSAGASIMSTTMIRYGTATEAVTDRGLCLVKHAVIDQHFSQRNRLERLLGVIEQSQGQVGIGVDEGAALVVQGNRLKVIGSTRITLCLPGKAAGDVSIHRLSEGEETFLVTTNSGGRAAWELRRRMLK